MTKKQPNLRERVKAAAAKQPKRSRNWCDRLPEKARQHAIAIRQDWQTGETGVSAQWMAKCIIEEFTRDGYETCGLQGMREWLGKGI